MGTGLGSLQRAILKLCLERYPDYIAPKHVLCTYYEFPINGNMESKHVFNRNAIGVKRYQSASASIQQAFNRLEKRGLIERGHGYSDIKLKEVELPLVRKLVRGFSF